MAIGFANTKHHHTNAYQHECRQRADVGQVIGRGVVSHECAKRDAYTGDDRGDMRGAILRMQLRRERWQQPVARHRVEDAWLPVLKHQQHCRHRHHCTGRHNPADRFQPSQRQRLREWIRPQQLIVLHHARRHCTDDHIDQRADCQSDQNPAWQIALGVDRLFAGGADRIESDVGKEYNGGALMNATPAVRCKRVVVGRIDMHRANDHEQRQHQQFDPNHDRIRPGAFLRTAAQQPGNRGDDQKRRQVDQHRNTRDMRCIHDDLLYRREGALHRLVVAVRQPPRQMNVESAEQRTEVAAPRDRHRHVTDGILKDQIPANDPRDQLAQRSVRIRVCAAGSRNHRGQLGITEPGQPADNAQQ